MSNLPDWARALGPALFAGTIRRTPDDFLVTEQLEIDCSGDGEHDWLYVEKSGANTHWVSEQLARHAGTKARDVGFAGLKDRHAVTRQWFSVRRPSVAGTDWSSFAAEGVRIVEQQVHHRKLKRGAHRGNVFCIALRSVGLAQSAEPIAERLELIEQCGVPNYFGEQRFGRNGSNIALGQAVIAGRRVSRHKRSMGISALRSLDFNNSLDERVRQGTWNLLLPGDVVNLDGTRSVFTVDEVTPELERRCVEMDIHPSAALPAIEEAGVKAASRPMRMRVSDLKWTLEKDVLWLEFQLPKGAFATTVLRELAVLQ